jgi:hypothetical protein
MSEIPAVVLSLDDIATIPDEDGIDWRPVRDALGVTAFGLNAFVGTEVGQLVVEPHDEADSGHEEVYAVVSGAARFKLDDAIVEVRAPAFVKPEGTGVHREAHALEPGTVVIAMGAAPGKVFEVSAWEIRELGRG